MTATINTALYEMTHGKSPRGHGRWAFLFGYAGDARASVDPVFCPREMLYSEAVKWARKEAKSRVTSCIRLAP